MEIREKIHQYIHLADERKIEAIYIMLEDNIASYGYSIEKIELCHERREKPSYTPRQSLNMIHALKK